MTGKAQAISPVKHILLAQTGMTSVTALVSAWYGANAAGSALAGGMICVAANLFAASRAFARPADDTAQTALTNLYRAEVGKLVMVLALCIAVFAGWKTVSIGAFLAGCVGSLMAGAVAAACRAPDRPSPVRRRDKNGLTTDG